LTHDCLAVGRNITDSHKRPAGHHPPQGDGGG
jgi:hypothetical protein